MGSVEGVAPEEPTVGSEPEPEATVEGPKADESDRAAFRAGDFVSYQGKLFGTLQEYMADRDRWALQLADGRLCAAKAEQLERAAFEPFARVEVVGADCGPLAGMCGEITGFLPERRRWTLKLDVGRDAAARADQLRLTDKPKPDEGDGGEHSCSCGGADKQSDDAHPENCLDSGDAPHLPGLTEADQALVSLVAQDGAAEKDWDKKSFQLHAAAIESRAAATAAQEEVPEELETRTGAELAARWAEIAPVRLECSRIHVVCLREPSETGPPTCAHSNCGSHSLHLPCSQLLEQHLATNPEMPCGHTCGACPTKTTCHLHDAIDEHGVAREFDIEDLAKPATPVEAAETETNAVHDSVAAALAKDGKSPTLAKGDKENSQGAIVLEV